MSRLELTFAMLKPHVLKNPYAVKTIQKMILTSNFKIVKSKKHQITAEEAQNFYAEHSGKFFFNRLITFMTSGPSILHILARENAIYKWRKLMGPTKIYKTQFEAPETIRGMFGLSDTRNATHGSDSPASAEKEIKVFFPYFNVSEWYEKEEPLFRDGRIEFVEDLFVHRIYNREQRNLGNRDSQR